MATANRTIRFRNNPKARGFVVSVLEEISRDDSPEALSLNCGSPIIKFAVIAERTAGTRKACDKLFHAMRAEFNAR